MWFRLAFVVSFAAAVSVATATARRATRRHGGTLNQLAHEIRGLLIVRAALGLVFYAALIAWLFLPRALPWTYISVPVAMRWLGVALLVPALAFFAWSFRSLGTNYRGGIGLYDAHELVTTGPYRWVRHPIYVAFTGIMLLILLVSANWLLALSGLFLVVSIAAARIPTEERELRERFGPAWESYQDRTGRLVPRFARNSRYSPRDGGHDTHVA
jgi:protein-S-isoprenylcysteine O-methyltransferase Ste14